MCLFSLHIHALSQKKKPCVETLLTDINLNVVRTTNDNALLQFFFRTISITVHLTHNNKKCSKTLSIHHNFSQDPGQSNEHLIFEQKQKAKFA